MLYAGPGQADSETALLRNEVGSVRYCEFLAQLGSLVPLDGAAPASLFLNLETGGKDGAYTYVWHDDIMQVRARGSAAADLSGQGVMFAPFLLDCGRCIFRYKK